MKKVILLTACTIAVLLSGCSDNELASVGDGIGTSTQSAIGFHVVGNQAETRATPITPSNITTTNFNVYAFTNDGTAFMGSNDAELGHKGINISCKGEEGSKKWDYTTPSELRYWPEKSTPLNFYAVSPGTFDKNIMPYYGWQFSHNEQKISYTCLDEYGTTSNPANIDVMYAIAKNQTKDNNAGKVKFTFKHILSQVVFKAKTLSQFVEVEIKDIKIFNFKMAGTYTLPSESTTNGTWALTEYTSNKPIPFTVVKDKNIKVNSTVTDISVDAPMLFLPQSLAAWDVRTPKTKEQANNAHESYLQIACKIKQDGKYLHGSEAEYGTLYVPFGPTWEQGKRYTYTLIFGGGYDDQGQPILQPINFEAEVDKWQELTGDDVNL